jgi:hypothetical protein
MSTQFRLKLPGSIDYKDILLKNGTCCNGYTAIPGGSFDSYHDCYSKGFYFIHATGDRVCGDQTLAQSDAPNNLSINDQTFWYWWYIHFAPDLWPWGKELKNVSTNARFETFKQRYKDISGFGYTGGIGFTLSGRPQSQSNSNPSSIDYWNSPLTETTYKDPNFLIKNHAWGYNNNNPKSGIIWDEESAINNGYSMPGSTGFKFNWEPIPEQMLPLVENSNLTNFGVTPTTNGTGVTYQLMDLRRFKFAHPFSKRMSNPRAHENRIGNGKLAAYWYSLLSSDGFTGMGPRNQTQRVNSPWQDNMADTTGQSFKTYLTKLLQLGITLSCVILDDEYLNQAFLPGSGLGDHSELVVPSFSGRDPQISYIPDKEFPLARVKGHPQFDGTIPLFPVSTAEAPVEWIFYRTTGITWWQDFVAGESYYNTFKNPNGNSIRNILNDPRWQEQGLTHLNGITLGALFTKRYNDLRNAWITGFSGTSFSHQISNDTIPNITAIIDFFKGWSGQYIKGTTHEIEKIDGGFTSYQSPSGETRIWLPATAWTSNAWPVTYPKQDGSLARLKIDDATIDAFNVTWTPYGGTLGVRTLHNLSSQIQWNDSGRAHFFKPQFMTEPSIINAGTAWAWSLQHVFRPAWDCLIGDIQNSQYSFDAFSIKSTQGLTAYPNGITFSHYDCYDLNAEESIYLVRSNAAELTYRLSGKNSTHSPVFYFNYGKLNILFPDRTDISLNTLNAGWLERFGYVKSATVPLEKYKIYHLAGTPVVGLNGITIDPPESPTAQYKLARWPSNEFVEISGPTFTQENVHNLQVRHKINQANTYARLLVHLQLLRGIMRSDPMGHVKLFPWSEPPSKIEDYQTEQIHHLILHGAKVILLFEITNEIPIRSCLMLEKILKDVNTMTGGGQLVPLGKFDINDPNSTWAESGSTGSNGNVVKMDQLVLEDSLENYILTGAKVTTGPFTGRHIWRITPSPVKINWTGNADSSLMRNGNLRIVVNGITHDQFIGDITKSDIQRSPGIYVVTNDNTNPNIQIIDP